MYKQLFVVFFVMMNFSSIQSLPSFRWRRSDSAPSTNSKFIDFTFFQSLPKYVFGPLRRSQPNEFISLNSLETPINRFDSSYNTYETFSNDAINVPTMKKSIQNNLNDIYSTNEPYEDDDVIVIPFTKHRGPAKFGDLDNKFPNAKNEHGVPSAVGFDSNQNQIINNNKNLVLNKKFESKVITDSEDDLDTGDELPSSLGTDDESSSDFKVQFSDLHPIYVKPPKSFQPVLYPNRVIDGVDKLTKRTDNQATIKPILADQKQELPNKYPNGLSSWILGGSRSMQRGSFWESLGNDESLHGYKTNQKVETDLNNETNSLEDVKSIKNSNDLNRQADNNLEFISLSEPKSRSSDDLELKQDKKVPKLIKKAHLISKFKNSSSLNKSKLQLKRNLTAKKVKILSKANKFFDKNVKNLN